MVSIRPCKTYEARVTGHERLSCADGRSIFKVYFVDVVGRAERENYEWARCDIRRSDLLSSLASLEGVEGIGFVTAFPHITKVFRFAPENEIVLHVRAWNTRDLAPIDLGRSDDYVEFACLAEAEIAADEYRFWAEAESVEAYLQPWSAYRGGAVQGHDKLRRYWPCSE